MDVTLNIRAKSHFNISVRDSNGNSTLETHDIYNVNTDYGYKNIYGVTGRINTFPETSTTYYKFRYLSIGSGNVPFTHSSLGLTSPISTRDGNTNPKSEFIPPERVIDEDGNYYIKVVTEYVWPLGALDNVTFSELGIFRLSSGNNTLMCGQVITDTEGFPMSITVRDWEQLVVTYTSYWPEISRQSINNQFYGGDYNHWDQLLINDHDTVDYRLSADYPPVSAFNYVTILPQDNTSGYISIAEEHRNLRDDWLESPTMTRSIRTPGQFVNLTIVDNYVEWAVRIRVGINTGPYDILGVYSCYRGTSSTSTSIGIVFKEPIHKGVDDELDLRFTFRLQWRD